MAAVAASLLCAIALAANAAEHAKRSPRTPVLHITWRGMSRPQSRTR